MKQTENAEQQADVQQYSAPEPEEMKEPAPPAANDDEQAEPPQPVEMVPKDEVARLVAEADARGYMRGRNEVAAMSMNTPRLWENPCRTAMEQECEPDPANGFLSKIRPGVWD